MLRVTCEGVASLHARPRGSRLLSGAPERRGGGGGGLMRAGGVLKLFRNLIQNIPVSVRVFDDNNM